MSCVCLPLTLVHRSIVQIVVFFIVRITIVEIAVAVIVIFIHFLIMFVQFFLQSVTRKLPHLINMPHPNKKLFSHLIIIIGIAFLFDHFRHFDLFLLFQHFQCLLDVDHFDFFLPTNRILLSLPVRSQFHWHSIPSKVTVFTVFRFREHLLQCDTLIVRMLLINWNAHITYDVLVRVTLNLFVMIYGRICVVR